MASVECAFACVLFGPIGWASRQPLLNHTVCLVLLASGCSVPRKLFPGKLWQRLSVAVPAAGPSSGCDHLLSRPLHQVPSVIVLTADIRPRSSQRSFPAASLINEKCLKEIMSCCTVFTSRPRGYGYDPKLIERCLKSVKGSVLENL